MDDVSTDEDEDNEELLIYTANEILKIRLLLVGFRRKRIRQAKKLDYKSFGVPNQPSSSFGVSTALQSVDGFFQKPQILESIQSSSFADLEFFGIMFCSVEDETPQRQMALASPDLDLMDDLVAFLEEEGSLKVKVVDRKHEKNLHVVYLDQGTATASRKQVVPILMEYFKKKNPEL